MTSVQGGFTFDDLGGLVVSGITASSGIGGGNAMTFSTTTTDADPGTGVVRFNNATQASATIIYMDAADTNGVDLTPFYKGIGEGLILTFRQSTAKWQTFIVQGVVAAAGYWKITVVWQMGGTALDDAAAISVDSTPTAPYLGTQTGDVTALTRNADGTVATITINGLVWTQTYNSNGTLNTETTGGLTRTYNYDASGIFTGVSGAVERNGTVNGTWANIKALSPAAAGAKVFVTDYLGGFEVIWNGTRWRFKSGEFVVPHAPTSVTGTTSETVLRSIVIPDDLMGTAGDQIEWYVSADANANNANAKTLRVRSDAGLTTDFNPTNVALANKLSAQSWWVASFASAASQYLYPSPQSTDSSTTAETNRTVDFSAGDVTLRVTGTLANTGDTIFLRGGYFKLRHI
jgi:hypothetical protein